MLTFFSQSVLYPPAAHTPIAVPAQKRYFCFKCPLTSHKSLFTLPPHFLINTSSPIHFLFTIYFVLRSLFYHLFIIQHPSFTFSGSLQKTPHLSDQSACTAYVSVAKVLLALLSTRTHGSLVPAARSKLHSDRSTLQSHSPTSTPLLHEYLLGIVHANALKIMLHTEDLESANDDNGKLIWAFCDTFPPFCQFRPQIRMQGD